MLLLVLSNTIIRLLSDKNFVHLLSSPQLHVFLRHCLSQATIAAAFAELRSLRTSAGGWPSGCSVALHSQVFPTLQGTDPDFLKGWRMQPGTVSSPWCGTWLLGNERWEGARQTHSLFLHFTDLTDYSVFLHPLSDLLCLIKLCPGGQALLCRASHLSLPHFFLSLSFSQLGSCNIRILGHNWYSIKY